VHNNVPLSQNLHQSQSIDIRDSLSATLRDDGWEFIDDPIASQVSLQNYNIHTSNIPKEKENLQACTNLLNSEKLDLSQITIQAQKYGIPHEVRTLVWQLCIGYLPLPKSTRSYHLLTKRNEYISLLLKYNVDKQNSSAWTKDDQQLYNLIKTDVLRTHPSQFIELFDNPLIRIA